MRAFKRTLALDPGYALAYEHIQSMLRRGGRAALLRAGGRRFLRRSPRAPAAAR